MMNRRTKLIVLENWNTSTKYKENTNTISKEKKLLEFFHISITILEAI